MRTWRKKLNRRLAEQIFLSAQKDYLTGDLQRQSRLLKVTYLLAGLVLATPILCILAAVALIWNFFPNLLLMVLAAVLLGIGYKLWPRRERIPPGSLGREDAPATFAIIDAIGDALSAPPIDRLVIEDDFNAYVGQAQGQNVLGIGAFFWAALPKDEKLALIAHELAHLVNDDPTRGRFLGAALNTLDGWHELFSPRRKTNDYGEVIFGADRTVIGDLVFGTFQLTIELFWGLMERLSFMPQQRAEYLADALSAEVAGKDAPIALLRRSALVERARVVLGGLGSYNLPRGRDLIDIVAKGTFEMPDAEREVLLAKMRQQDYSIDDTHPPSAYRVKFLELLPIETPGLNASDLNFAAADAELSPHIAKIGDQIAARIVVQ